MIHYIKVGGLQNGLKKHKILNWRCQKEIVLKKLTNPYSMDWSHDNWYDLASFHLLLNDDTLVQFLRHVWQYCDPRYWMIVASVQFHPLQEKLGIKILFENYQNFIVWIFVTKDNI